jgi:serine/threonine-protein kinase
MAEPSAQRMIGRYALVGEIASGGMATVHYGRLVGVAGFTKPVAIKRLHPHFAKDPDFAAMFLDEARLAAQVRHPNVVSLLDVVVERGELFLVMELVRGEVLSRLVRPARTDLSHVRATGSMPVEVAVAISVGMLEGLHAAHEARGEDGEPLGIVHRDVSPQNVLVGVDGIARVIDFGVAKAVGQSRVTREGQIKGKVAYMAPEQLRARPLDRRADVYSAAVVLWEVLAGRRLFAQAESDAALVQMALSSAPEPPSAHRPDLPAGLDTVVMRGLAREPGARFATAREMAKALERVVAPAAPREVGLWVEAAAGATIRERALRIEDMERASVVTLAPEEAAALSEKLGNDVTPPGAAERPPPAELSSISVSTARPAPPPRSRAPRTAALVALLGCAAAAGFYGARWMPTPEGGPPAVEAQAASVVAQPSAAAQETAATAPPVETAAAPPASATATASAAAARPPALPRAPKAGARPAKPRSDCEPPYEVTADGVRRYKPQCLR